MIERAEPFLRQLFDRAVEVADPMRSLKDFLPEKPKGRIIVVGAGKASYPVAEKVNVFGKLGVAHNKNDVNLRGLAGNYSGESSRNSAYAALGAEYAVNEKVALSLEYEHYGKNEVDIGRSKGAVSLNARYSF